MLVRLFGFILCAGVVLTSVAMVSLRGKWQAIEAGVYGGARRPAWFWIVSLLMLVLYIAALVAFIKGPKNWAGWVLMVVIPLGWLAKGGLVIFNKQGRKAVSGISGDSAWLKIGLSRLPVAAVLGALAALAR